MKTLKELFAELEPEPIKCSCGKEVVFTRVKADEPNTYRFQWPGCSCGIQTLNLPEHVVVGPESGPLFAYRRRS